MKTELTRLDLTSWLGYIVFAANTVILPLCLPEVSADLKASFSEAGGLETARTFVVLVILIMGGVWSRYCGKKPLLSLGQYCMTAGLLLASFATTYLSLVISMMIASVGSGFAESLINPLVADLHPRHTGRYLNLTNAFFSAGVLLASLVFGELLTGGISWRWIFRINAAGALVTGFFFNIQRFPPQAPREAAFHIIIKNILRHPGFWLYALAICLGGGAEIAFSFWSRSYVDAYLASLPRAGTFAVVLFSGAMVLGRLLAARLSRRFRLQTIMRLSAFLGILVSALVPLADNLLLFYLLITLAGLATACFWPSILAGAGEMIKADSTVLYILVSFVGALGVGLVPFLMGILGDAWGLRSSFYAVPGLFLLLLVTLRLIDLRQRKSRSL